MKRLLISALISMFFLASFAEEKESTPKKYVNSLELRVIKQELQERRR